jgi:quercetin dioxygenase-like cupin family protein
MPGIRSKEEALPPGDAARPLPHPAPTSQPRCEDTNDITKETSMPTTHGAYALAPGEGEIRWGLDGALTTFKATAAQTSGKFAIIEDRAAKNDGIPFHRHVADDETFYVLEGHVTFFLGDNPPRSAGPGTFVHIPGGEVHAFRVDSEEARYLIITTPRHEQFYRAISRPASSHELPPAAPLDMEQIERACQDYGVEIVGPPPGPA